MQSGHITLIDAPENKDTQPSYVTLIDAPNSEDENMPQALPQDIQALNDRFRATMSGSLGRAVITRGIAERFEPIKQQWIIESVRKFNDFTEDNDPYKEHDFGSFEMFGEKFFWKIDYYAPDMESGSEDPSDPDKSFRVLTIMLAEEY